MHCECCDTNLTDYESTLRSKTTGEFLDSCIKCLRLAGIKYIGNPALKQKQEIVEEAWEELNFEDE